MKIIVKNNRVTLDDYSTTVNAVSYYVSPSRDSVTYRVDNVYKKTGIVSQTTVNDLQMTTDNIDDLLSNLFINKANDNGESGGSSSNSDIQTPPYTRVEYSDPMVFPKPIHSGHIVEFYKNLVLYQSYQWNGWLWQIIGAEPNLIFTEPTDRNQRNDLSNSNIVFYSKVQDRNYLTLDPTKDYSQLSIYAKNIEQISKDYTLGYVYVYVSDSDNDIIVLPIKANTFQVTDSGFTNIQHKNFHISDCEIKSYSVSLKATDSVIENMNILDNMSEGGYGSISLSGENVVIKNSPISTVQLSVSKQTENSTTPLNIEITDNFTFNDNISASIYIMGNTESLSAKVNIKIKGNQGISSFTISEFDDHSVIETFDVEFDKYLSGISFYNVTLTDVALSSFIDTLVNLPVGENLRSFSYGESNKPALTDDQKTRLANANWTLW